MSYSVTSEGITVVDGVEVDITVRDAGAGEQDASKVMMDLKERLGRLGAAFAAETPPDDIGDVPVEYLSPMTVAWDRHFGDDEGGGPA